MAEMKDSGVAWINTIPMAWKVKKIKYTLQSRNENNNPIRSRNILSLTAKQGVIPIEEKEGGGNKPKEDFSAYKLAYPNDIVMNSMNILSGSVGLSNYFGCVSPVYYMLRPISKEDDVRYYNYIFQTTVFQKSLLGLGNGILMKESDNGKLNTIRMRIPLDKLGNLLIPVPDSKTQKKIANQLDGIVPNIDTLRLDIEKQIETLEEYKKSIITEAVTKGLDPDVEMKDSGIEWIGMIPNKWGCKKIKYVTNLSRGIFGHRPRNDPRYYDGKYPFIQTGDVACATKVINNYSQTLNELGKKVSREFKEGTIAFTLAANVGDVSILGFNAYFPDSIMAVIPHKEIDNMYLYYILSIMKKEFLRVAIINTQLNLNVERVGNLYIPITFEKTEQKEIVEYLDEKCAEIDGAIEEKKEQLEVLDQYKKSLIYEYVTGKKEVPED